jgi:hypothetical protein
MGRTAAEGIRQSQHRRVRAIVPDRRAAAADAGICRPQAVRIARQLGGVGRQRKLPQHAVSQIPGKAAEQLHDFLPHQRLAAGNPDLFDPGGDEAPGDPVELFEREQFLAWQKRHRLGHAVSASQIATIRHRQPQVFHAPAKPINKRNRHRLPPFPRLLSSSDHHAITHPPPPACRAPTRIFPAACRRAHPCASRPRRWLPNRQNSRRAQRAR